MVVGCFLKVDLEVFPGAADAMFTPWFLFLSGGDVCVVHPFAISTTTVTSATTFSAVVSLRGSGSEILIHKIALAVVDEEVREVFLLLLRFTAVLAAIVEVERTRSVT